MNDNNTKIINHNSDSNLAAGARRNGLLKTTGLLLLLSAISLQGQAGACPRADHTARPQPVKAVVHPAQKETTSIGPDYYQSSDNPYLAD